MAVVDALVSKVVDMLISTISREIEQQFRLVVGADQDVQRLTSTLQSIQAVLIDAERRQLKEVTVQLWLDRLKSVAYDIDDVLDEWNYEILKSQIQRDENSHNPTRKVWSFSFLFCCFSFRKVFLRHHIAIKINDLNQRLDVIAAEKDRYGFLSLRGNDEHVERLITTSVINMSEVKGREVEREKLVNLLLAECSQMSKLRLIPIVGMGGIGKTTLAGVVYNDETVKHHFDKRIWVCVSDPFDEIKVAKEILESLQGAAPNLVSFSNITEKIQESVEGKKVLVVLDDVWNEDPKKWKQLGDCLQSGSHGSRVLVTMRNENVGRIMGCLESDIFRVGLLFEEESWELFCMIAFSRRSNEERTSLEEIGREVVGRCKGLPLAIRAIAGLLQFKNSRIEWKSVLDSELWDLEEVQRDVTAPLWLSYYDLPSHLKQCFSYCVIFPKDYRMKKSDLIRLWMSQGYIKGTQSKDMEMLGGEYFQNLVTRSLLQDVEVEEDSYLRVVTETWCKMHDIVHDFAQSLVKKECTSIKIDNDSFDDSHGNLSRHLSVSFTSGARCPDSFYNLKKLRSLIALSVTRLDIDLKKAFNEFTSLRSLSLYLCAIVEVPSNINRLIHLKELDLSHNRDLQELPHTTWELYNLQILFLVGTSIQSIKGIERLTNLRHLEQPSIDILLPKEMVRLSGLRTLESFSIDVDDVEAFSLKHLKNLNRLGGSLEIKWLKRGDGDVEDAKQAHLQDKIHITRLALSLSDKETHRREMQDEELLDALNMPPNSEILEIRNYQGLKTPNWLDSLTSVKVVGLYRSNIEKMPPLGKLPCLECLYFINFFKVVKVGAEFLGMDDTMLSSSSTIVLFFPKLTSLMFNCFEDWEEWNDVDLEDEMSIMPSLTCLKLLACPKLKALPNFILKKTALDIERW